MAGIAPDSDFAKLALKHPELPGAKPAGIVRRFPAFFLDLSICFWMTSFALAPIAERFRNRFLEIVQIRSIALAIDAGTAAPGQIANAMQGALVETLTDIQEMNVVFASAFAIVSTFCLLSYFVLFEGSPFSASPGKLAFGLRVVDRGLSPISFLRALARQLAGTLSILSFGIGALLMAAPPEKLALQDRLSRTRVIYFRSRLRQLYRIGVFVTVAASAGAAALSIYNKAVVAIHWIRVADAAATQLQSMGMLGQ